MTALLNLIPLALGLSALWAIWKRKWPLLAALLVAFLVYAVLQPSYLPKGEVQRTSVPTFSASDAQIEDRNSKPVPLDEKERRREEAIRNGLPFTK